MSFIQNSIIQSLVPHWNIVIYEGYISGKTKWLFLLFNNEKVCFKVEGK